MTFATLDTTCTRLGEKADAPILPSVCGSESIGRYIPRELTLEEMLASPGVRQLMRRDGVDPGYVRALISSLAGRAGNSR
jgi:hypothetical protein